MTSERIDRILALVLIVTFGALVFGALGWPPGAKVLPVTVGILGVFTATMLLVQSVRQDKSDTEYQATNYGRLIAFLASIVLFVAVIEPIGLLLTLPVFLFVTIAWVGGVNFRRALVVSVLLSACFFLLFDLALNVPLPNGLLSPWLD